MTDRFICMTCHRPSRQAYCQSCMLMTEYCAQCDMFKPIACFTDKNHYNKNCMECNVRLHNILGNDMDLVESDIFIDDNSGKICSTCNIKRNNENFTKDRRYRDGLCHMCKFCYNKYTCDKVRKPISKYKITSALCSKIAAIYPRRVCPKCQQIKPRSEFSLRFTSYDMLQTRCKECINSQ